MTNMEKAINELQNRFPNISGIKPAAYLGYNGTDAIFLGNAAEGGEINGVDAANYYAYNDSNRIFGVHKDLVEVLENFGYYAEWYDSGTLIAYLF